MPKHLTYLLVGLVLLLGACGLVVGKGPTGRAQELCGGAWLRSPDPEGSEPYWEPEAPCPDPQATSTLVPTPTNTPTPLPTATATATSAAPPTATRTSQPTLTVRPRPTRNPNAIDRIVPSQYATIASAISASQSGDVIRIRAGVYPAGISINKNGISVEPFGDGPVWIDGNCAAAVGLEILTNDVVVLGLGIRNVTYAGIYINGTDYPTPARVWAENNTIQDFNCTGGGDESYAGISIWYGGSEQYLIGNTITHRVNATTSGLGNGIYLKGSSEIPSGGGHVITDNVITGGRDGIGSQNEDDVRGGFDRNTLIARNTVRGCRDDGIQVEGGNTNIHVIDNRIEECGYGIALAPNLVGPLYVERNFITSRTPGVANTIACFKVGNGGGGFAYLTDNYCEVFTSVSGVQADGIGQTNSGLQGFVLSGNVFKTTRYVFDLTGTPLAGSSFNDACHYSTRDGLDNVYKFSNVRYGSLANAQASTGYTITNQWGNC